MEDSKLSVLFAFIVYSALMWIALLITSMYCYTRIYLALRSHIKEHVIPHGEPSGISQLYLSRYKKTVSTALWLFAADAIIGNQAFENGRCHIYFSSGLDKVETGYNLLME